MQAQRDPIVWACIALRLLVFSEIRFAFQKWQAGKPGALSVSPALAILDQPWPKATTGDLLARMEVDASMYGNSYWVRDSAQLVRLDPTRVTIATTDAVDQVTGNVYGRKLLGYFLNDSRGQIAATFLPEEVAHYRPIPDPAHEFRGASWLNALLPDVIADMDLTDYKHSFLKNAATPNLAVVFQNKVSQEAFNAFRDKMEASHTGPQAGFKTLYLGAGVDVKVLGSNFADLAMSAVQSQGETRIASAAGVPPGLLGLAEALKGSTLNAGNYAATRRRFSDATVRPLWRSASGALSVLVPVPPASRLWYDASDVQFLQEDIKDAAAAQGEQAKTILTLIQAGWEPDSVVKAVTTGDMTVLSHTGLVSVQLQKAGPPLPPGGEAQPDPMLPSTTGGDDTVPAGDGDNPTPPPAGGDDPDD